MGRFVDHGLPRCIQLGSLPIHAPLYPRCGASAASGVSQVRKATRRHHDTTLGGTAGCSYQPTPISSKGTTGETRNHASGQSWSFVEGVEEAGPRGKGSVGRLKSRARFHRDIVVACLPRDLCQASPYRRRRMAPGRTPLPLQKLACHAARWSIHCAEIMI